MFCSGWVEYKRGQGYSIDQIQQWAWHNPILSNDAIRTINIATSDDAVKYRDKMKAYWKQDGKTYATLLALLTSMYGGEVVAELGLSEKLGAAIAEGKDFVNDKSLEIWLRSANFLNVNRTKIASALISALGEDAPQSVINAIKNWGNKFTNPTELGKQGLDAIEKGPDVIEFFKKIFKGE